jgi:hypothetical protein
MRITITIMHHRASCKINVLLSNGLNRKSEEELIKDGTKYQYLRNAGKGTVEWLMHCVGSLIEN